MKIGIVGLGRMGNAIAYRMMQGGHTVVGFDPNPQAVKQAQEFGLLPATSLQDLAQQVRIIWLMVPAGNVIQNVLEELLPHLQKGDIVIDGGNSFWKNSQQRAQLLKDNDIHYLDCGTSGGIHGKKDGFCLMIGGQKEIYDKVEPIFAAVSVPGGYLYVGPSGAGHYVKMVHNGIEYGLLQAYADGFHLLKEGAFASAHLDLEKISALWNTNAVIRSFLLGLLHDVFKDDQDLEDVLGTIAESGMGKWTVQEAHEQNIPVEVIEKSLDVRAWSRETGGNYGTKLVAMLRNKFGGHAVSKKGDS